MRTGAHLPIARGVDRAILLAGELGLGAIQVFSRSPRGGRARPWGEDEIDRIRSAVKATGIRPFVIHVPYLVNVASSHAHTREYGLEVLIEDLERADMVGADCLVLHPGSHGGDGEDVGYERMVYALSAAISTGARTRLLVETMAGQKSELGADVSRLAVEVSRVAGEPRPGLCLDSCHLFAAGYDIRRQDTVAAVWTAAERTLGSNAVGLVHINDSVFDCGSRRDRHARIDRGFIGADGLTPLLSMCTARDVAVILETPVTEPGEYSDEARLLPRV